MWVVANEKRTKYLAHDEDGNRFIVENWLESTAFDSPSEAVDESYSLASDLNMSPFNCDDMLTAQLR
ncbi:hypothetical protein [Rheinheimera sp.]|uniref:hypothetical protein n=1 Tax=Rheinheimera sp. TaxID=1869214 RepID=UPI004047A402